MRLEIFPAKPKWPRCSFLCHERTKSLPSTSNVHLRVPSNSEQTQVQKRRRRGKKREMREERKEGRKERGKERRDRGKKGWKETGRHFPCLCFKHAILAMWAYTPQIHEGGSPVTLRGRVVAHTWARVPIHLHQRYTLLGKDSLKPGLTHFPCFTVEADPGWTPTPGVRWVPSRKGTMNALQVALSSGVAGIVPTGLSDSADWEWWAMWKMRVTGGETYLKSKPS